MAMQKQDFDKIYAGVEANRFEFDILYGNAFRDAANQYSEELSEEQTKQLEYEFLIFRLMTVDQLEDPKRPRFVPSVVYTDGKVFPDITDLSEEQLAYYRERAKQTQNPVMRARYLDFLFEYDPTLKKVESVQTLVDSYIEASKTYDHNNEKERIDCLDRAFVLSKRFSQRYSELLPRVTAAMIDRLKGQRTENIRWTLEFIETILKYPADFPQGSVELAKEITDEGVIHYTERDNNFNLREAFVLLRNKIAKSTNPNFDSQQAARDLAQPYLDEAARRTDSEIVQQHFLMQAHAILHKAGLKEDAAKLVQQVEKIGASDTYMAQFKTFSVEQELPSAMFDELREQIKGSPDIGAFVGLSPNLQSSWTKAESDTEKPVGLTDIFQETHINARGVPVPTEPDDVEHRRTMRSFALDVGFRHVLLKATFGKLISDKEIKLSDILKHFQKVEQVDEKSWKSIKKGLELFFAHEHFAAVGILIPQFENLLFQLLPIIYGSTQNTSTGDGAGILPKTLTPILSSIRTVIHEDLYQYMTYTLTSASSFNLRNKVAHGEVKLDDDNELYGLIAIQLFLMILVNMEPVENDKPNAQ